MDIEIFEKDRKILNEFSNVIGSLNHDGCLMFEEYETLAKVESVLSRYIANSKPRNYIPKLPKEVWVKAFAAAVELAMDKGYFDDILMFSLYADCPLEDDASEEEERQYYDNLWGRVDEAFEEVFGIKKGETNYV